MPQVAADRFPQANPPACAIHRGHKELATGLLNLVDCERQKHQQRQDRRQIPRAVTVIVFKMIALILERIEGLVLHAPAATTRLLIQLKVLLAKVEIGHPAESLDNRIVTAVKLMML